jgi:hypothetical protein
MHTFRGLSDENDDAHDAFKGLLHFDAGRLTSEVLNRHCENILSMTWRAI